MTAGPPDYVLDEQVGYLLRLATQRHTALFAVHAPADLTPMQFSAMIRLAERGACSQNELGRSAAMDISTIKGVVDRLRQKGLVETAPSAEDRRRSVVSLTAAGRALMPELEAAGRRITAATLAPLAEVERETLAGLLGRLV